MTTTLRPTGPEERGPEGARSRDFTVCVNGRPVGRLALATDERFGPGAGRLVRLEIDEPDQRRGRGAVACLAAEEVLRGWGCRQVYVTVPADARHARRLATALGYTERNHGMVKRLIGPPPGLPRTVALRPMDEEVYRRWHGRTRAAYMGHLVEGGLPAERAAAVADADYARTLPDGCRTEGAALRVLADESTDVGWLWLRLPVPGDGRFAGLPWVYLVEVAAAHRGRGHGRTLMLAAERECLAAGATDLGLNVFADNTTALGLYESLGYQPTAYQMVKPLL